MTGPRSLAEAQRRFQHALLDPSQDAPEAVRDLVTSTERFILYRRGYRLRLLETMRALHPALRTLLGPGLFDDFALGYLDARPSRSYTLARLDERFPEHLAAGRPDGGEPPGRREPWIDLMIDLARYERAFAEVYDGAGIEDGAGIKDGPGTEDGSRTEDRDDPESTGLVPAEDGFLDAVAFPAPCVRVMHACAPVHEYHAAALRGRAGDPPRPRPVGLVLSRRDYTVVTVELPPAPYRLLKTLLESRATVREAAAKARIAPGEAGGLVGAWARSGWISVRGTGAHASLPAPPPREEKTTAWPTT
ncbi:HvfC/BufC family peptide modification chaperone [Streptomyces sp. URMC 127]|uniref:HvfC/BufC family peptide modification chaperone n=1 Tax=Streptomyces sp. URMC 127 TaxID=3423402 RepID=UPI003F1BEDD3